MITRYNLFLESKKTESETLNIVDENVLEELKKIDKSKNQVLLPSMAYFYDQADLQSLDQVFNKVTNLIKRNKISIQYTKNGVKVNDKLFKDWLKFSEKIDGIYSSLNYKSKPKSPTQIDKTENPIWEGNGIRIYDGSDVGKCIRLGKGYDFCVSKPGNTMFQSYRDTKESTFYFIFDDNQKDNPLHIVVFDNTKYGVELTDAKNTTGDIHKFGSDSDKYINYLENKGVPIDLLTNKPKSKEEIAEQEKLGNLHEGLTWFKKLSYDYKSKYIGRGHLLTNEQFKYLYDNKVWKLIHQYVTIGHRISNEQLYLLKNKKYLLKSYLISLKQATNIIVTNKEIKYMYKLGMFKEDTEENSIYRYIGSEGKDIDSRMKKYKETFDELINPNELEKITTDEYPNSIFWRKEGEVILEYDIKNGWFWVDYDDIWSKFEEKYSLNYIYIRQLLDGLLEEAFKLRVTTAPKRGTLMDQRWRRLSN